MSDSLWLRGLQHIRLRGPSLPPRVCLLDSCPLNWWCHPIVSSSVTLFFSCAQSFPSSGSFAVSWLLASGGRTIGASASASVLPMNIQDWFPLGLTGWLSLQSKGLSRVFSSTTDWKHQFFNDAFLMVLLSYLNGLTLTSIHDYWKNHSFDYMLKGLASNENAGCWLRN